MKNDVEIISQISDAPTIQTFESDTEVPEDPVEEPVYLDRKRFGFYKIIESRGEGIDKPGTIDEVIIRMCDTTEELNELGDPIEIKLGCGMLPAALEKTIVSMKKDEMVEVHIPAKFHDGVDKKYRVHLLSFLNVHDLRGDGILIKRVLNKGSGYDRVDEKDEIKFSVKIWQGDSVFYENQEIDTTGSSELICPGLFEILKTMKKGEISQIIVNYHYFIENFTSINKENLLQSDVKVDINLMELVKIRDIFGDGFFYKKILEYGDRSNASQLNANIEVFYKLVIEDQIIISNFDQEPLESRLDEDEFPTLWIQCIKFMKVGEYAMIDCNLTGPNNSYMNDGLNPILNPEIPENIKKAHVYLKLFSSDLGKTNHGMEVEERLEEALRLKEVALKYYKLGKIEKALKKYDDAKTSVEPIKDAPEDHKPTIVILLNNIALCNIKLEKMREAELAVNKALEIFPEDIKSLYRRATARTGLSDYIGALNDLNLAKEVIIRKNETDMLATIENEIKKVQILNKKYHQKEKEIYKKLFR
ncbi:unnamed protein product [Blepharisma stoltei]|uniref:Peptidylprolyl isomerase n=1 Tax=Blepharisma stoltei TaxID=1481888 RepID=A0AAU9KA09_9CILI|nr:unnamed protein product [Blepharisma stoltei]